MIARAEQELRADIDRALLIGTHLDGRVPVEAQFLFAVLRIGLDGRDFVREAIDAADFATLRFGVDVCRVGRIFPRPEAIAAEHILPARIRNATGIRGIAHPGAVILQAAVDVVRLGLVHADVIELRHRQIHQVLPARAAILTAPQAAIVAGEDQCWNCRGRSTRRENRRARRSKPC